MLSWCELDRAARLLSAKLLNAELRRVDPTGAHGIVLTFDQMREKCHLFLSCCPESARICLVESIQPDASIGSFHEYMRAHLVRSMMLGLEIQVGDRRIGLLLRSPSGTFRLMLSILGARSNIYLIDASDRLLHALRPLADTRRELELGGAWTDPRGSLASCGTDRWAGLSDDRFFPSIEEFYRGLELQRQADRIARQMEQALNKEKRFLERKHANLQEDLAKALQAEKHLHLGEGLKSVLHTISTGDCEAQATDYETGEILRIPLDSHLSPSENLESYFSRYQKESRGVERIGRQLEEVQAELLRLDDAERQLRDAVRTETADSAALERIGALPLMMRVLPRVLSPSPSSANPKTAGNKAPGARKEKRKSDIPSRLRPKRYQTRDGLEIWVGRNDEANDYLTTRLARGNDLFFHLEGYPGSHVVLRTEGKSDPGSQSVLDACELAVHFSKLKNASRADVHMAPIKNVKKPKGAKPGLVYVRSGRTIHLRRDPKRLEEILASRLEE